jgi:hypothetical protein
VVVVAFRRTHLHKHAGVWFLAGVAMLAPLQIYAVYRWDDAAGMLYGLLCYAAAIGFALRLEDRLPRAAHWPLILVLVATVFAALTFLPTVTWPFVSAEGPLAETELSGDTLRDSLHRLDRALLQMQREEKKLKDTTSSLTTEIERHAAVMRNLEEQREDLATEIHRTQLLKVEADAHDRPSPTSLMSFLTGIASSITAAFAWSFVERRG